MPFLFANEEKKKQEKVDGGMWGTSLAWARPADGPLQHGRRLIIESVGSRLFMPVSKQCIQTSQRMGELGFLRIKKSKYSWKEDHTCLIAAVFGFL